ncbi:ribosomal protein L7/L12 [Microbacterium azadirachtae]|uniref:50S ribosomal protein L7/L12 n=1 Tax=Microbacterium azadirachtae TaxID=582680 RepID=A0A0F0LRT7_9MICO|nr:ribosomal protein L7/L12 [Microbacterium azadirachtae]KJL34211.1 50S ribosomal protein L7/L12 [Microbacterium azadirachtae]
MDLWIWILLAGVIVILFIVIAVTLRAIRPKAPEPLGTTLATPSAATPAARAAAATSAAASTRRESPATPGPLAPSVIAEIDALVAADQKISAIKVLREHSGLSLRAAKDQIDAWIPSAPGTMNSAPVSLTRSDSRPAGAPSYAGELSASEAVAHLDPNVRAEIGRLIAAEQKIAAIKLLREATGLGLKDSKNAVESWR